MKKLLLILLCLPIIGFGQNWIRTYEGINPEFIKQTNDGGYILAGNVYTSANLVVPHFNITKIDANGILQWSNNSLEFSFI